MLYIDTSLLVAALTNEAASERVLNWIDHQLPDELAISPWVVTEFSAAMSVKLRTGAVTAGERAQALTAFRQLAATSLHWIPVESRLFEVAARLADSHASGLRAGDALHLAIVADQNACLCTLDRRLAHAADTLGIRAILI